MGTITIVGLGPGEARHLTREAWEVLESSPEVWLRTERHPTASSLPPGLRRYSFDDVYDDGDDFARVYDAIVQRVLEMGQRPGGVVYAVPGHPLVGEATVEAILSSAERLSLPVRVVEGLSFVEPTLTALRIDALQGLQIVDAIGLARSHHPPLNPDLPALVGQLYSRLLASEVKLTLMNQYPDEHEVFLVHAAGTREACVTPRLLYQLDRADDAAAAVAHLTTLYVPPLADVTSFEGLQETVAHLRAPEGCPWDREQTHESLRTGLLEEAYESAGAIDRGDTDALQEELGDLLLQVLLQTQIATEAGEFKMPDVIAGIDGKLKHRHPHVWGGRDVADTQEVLHNWEELKREEKQDRSSVLDGVPRVLPALQQADTYGRRVARVGFDWPDVEGVVDKVREELAELESASTHERQEAELGDLLFAVANWARWLGIDPETALRQANARFAERFCWLERVAIERGLDVAALSIDELEALWQEAKRSKGGP
ncbi:MAG: nucleoside triphosphate pyrophosphohydrolase [Anaerolineae bacterium]|jgi:tetrapyrrole methylase family protein/MazG family protein